LEESSVTLPQKFANRIETVRGLAADAWQVAGQEAASIMADTERALKRAVRRAEVPAGYERMTFTQDKGATVEATVRLLAQTALQIIAHRGQELEIALEIYESAAGALLAVSASTLPGGTGREDVRVTVVPPTDDVLAMRIAVMDAFSWSDYARSMARKLGWNLIVEVD
jgi:hypothetical protein